MNRHGTTSLMEDTGDEQIADIAGGGDTLFHKQCQWLSDQAGHHRGRQHFGQSGPLVDYREL